MSLKFGETERNFIVSVVENFPHLGQNLRETVDRIFPDSSSGTFFPLFTPPLISLLRPKKVQFFTFF